MSKPKTAVVIGAGFGGLAAAIRLQNAGFKTTILEKRDKPGGKAYVYKEDGFVFDAGPTVITAPQCLEELFAIAGKNMADYLTLKKVDPFYRICFEDGYTFNYCADENLLLEQIHRRSPEDVDGYLRFLKYSEEVYKEGYEKLCHVPFLKFRDMLRVAPKLIRLQAYRSVYSAVKRFIKDKHLRQIFSFNSLLIGGNPFSASAIYTLIHPLEKKFGVSFPVGGTHALVSALAKLFVDLGGEIRMNAAVEKIATDQDQVKGVHTSQGFEAFDMVVSNADVSYTYSKLLKDETRLRVKAKRLAKKAHSPSLFLVYFGTNREFNQLSQHNIFFGPRYKEHLADIFKGGKIPEDFSLYVHAPSIHNKEFAPAGCQAFYALSVVPNLAKHDPDWAEIKEAYAEKILNYLDERYMPGLKASLVKIKIFSPNDFSDEMNAHHGSAFSLEPLLWQSAWFRIHNRDAKIKGLYFVGAGTHPGAGIPGVIGSAKATAATIITDVCEEKIARGSLSFNLAAKLLPSRVREFIFALYAWCRDSDDKIDFAEKSATTAEKLLLISDLRMQTQLAFSVNGNASSPEYVAFSNMVKMCKIPAYYAHELIMGMEMDAKSTHYRTFDELLLYCYRVAGTVGLMASHIFGLNKEGALKNAADLGIAMQLTNIARDIIDDAKMGRVYLPEAWLKEKGLGDIADVLDAKNRPALANLASRLLDEAEGYYATGWQGLSSLPLRCALAVASAHHIYREIGVMVRARGENAWDTRTWVSFPRKFMLITKAALQILSMTPARMVQPWRGVTIATIRRHT